MVVKSTVPVGFIKEIKEKYQIDFKTINLQYDYIGKKENLESIKEDIKRILNVA